MPATYLARMRRGTAAVVVSVGALALVIVFALAGGGAAGRSGEAERGVTHAGAPGCGREVTEPPIRVHLIPHGRDRKRQIATYSRRHHGKGTWRLDDPRTIVLHCTAGRSYSSTRAASGGARLQFGRSVEGRALVARGLGDPAAARTALIVGEIHGDEPAGRTVIRRLRHRPGRLRGVEAWTVSSLNPDGHHDGRRTNVHGVDLNRNFSVGWDGSEPPGSGYYAGSRPFSEPETRALRRLVRRLDPDVTIFYHQPWGAVLLPCSEPAPLQKRYAQIAGLPGDRCRGQRLPGTATRWMNGRGGTAFVVELEAGALSRRTVRRHARAAARVATG